MRDQTPQETRTAARPSRGADSGRAVAARGGSWAASGVGVAKDLDANSHSTGVRTTRYQGSWPT